ncbi:NAD(P)-binding protein [Cucurbitaria berberidis CBS 394.84]|uniref:NAD(P)-binding protein n=1 Tax=Cucurbitaria berberidis CBS 394.84 TaxID=1168544 RepID=A0A9P4GJB8_9PLEO|nr:NAD(P)-binding protein [Cucurbitaria berberidis CBS 394.84]KAF1847288.1 NAD(P)-binding protein [Cucurbitaria berberidis CBS 394.84]
MALEHRGLVAITGANGTIGYACVVYALQNGYRVRCVVRREAAIAVMKSGPSIQQYIDRIEFAVVANNAIEGAYDKALAGVDYAVHVAGAWPLPHLHPDDEIYYPFMNSMKNILQAAKKSGTVKRLVFTQAGAGLVNSEDGDSMGNRMNQNIRVNQVSLSFTPPLKSSHNAYCASKSQCMTYLNSLRLSRTTPFSIVQIIPGTVIGPSELATTTSQAYSQMDRQTKALIFDEMKPKYAFGFVHVQDCARVHIEALDEIKVKSEDLPSWFIAGATVEEGFDGPRLWNKAADMIERVFKGEVEEGVFTVGRTKVPINMPYRIDSRLTENTLLGGENIRGLEESVKEVAQWYVGLKRKENLLQMLSDEHDHSGNKG